VALPVKVSAVVLDSAAAPGTLARLLLNKEHLNIPGGSDATGMFAICGFIRP
jgi:hypothetical protein